MKDRILKIQMLWYTLKHAFEGWKRGTWDVDLDAPMCCDGYMCGCGASSLRHMWEYESSKK